MSQQNKKRKSKKGGGMQDLQQEEHLQAILLADSFGESFRPITLEKPKVLLPLVNIPMLEYSLELLASNGVHEIFLFCSWQAEQVRAYIQESKWAHSRTPVVRIIASSSVTSAGDALREIDGMGVIRSDPFVLLSGDVVSNMDLRKAITQHESRREKDSNCIMTIVFKKAGSHHRSRPLESDLVVAVDARSGQILRYEDSGSEPSVDVDMELFREHPEIQMCYDLLDCHIDICSPQVLLQIAENYDYMDIRRDFIHNEVRNRELGYRLFAHVIRNKYAARVHCPRTYDAVCQDILRRWTYPMVPDNNILGHTDFRLDAGGAGRYREAGASVARSAVLGRDTVLSAGSTICERANVSGTVVGRNCTIGEGALVSGSYLWRGVVVEAGAVVDRAILCDGVHVKRGAVVNRGCILGFGTVVGADFVLKPFTRITKASSLRSTFDDQFGSSGSDDSDSGEQEEVLGDGEDTLEWAESVVGVGGVGRLYHVNEGTDEYSDDDSDDAPGVALFKTVVGGVGKVAEGLSQQSLCMGCEEAEATRAKLWASWPHDEYDAGDAEAVTGSIGGFETPEQRFSRGILDMLAAASSLENIALELSCFKHAENRSFADILAVVTPYVLQQVPCGSDKGQRQILASFQGVFSTWAPLLQRFVQTPEDGLVLLRAIEVHTVEPLLREALSPLFPFLLKLLHFDFGLVSEDAVQLWVDGHREQHQEGGFAADLFNLPLTQRMLSQILEESESSAGSGTSSSSSGDEESASGSSSSDEEED